MRNPNLDYKAGLIDLYLVTLEINDSVRFLGECAEPMVRYLKTLPQEEGVKLVARPSQSVMRFTENDVVGIGEAQ